MCLNSSIRHARLGLGIFSLAPVKSFLPGLLCLLLAGCAAFEASPAMRMLHHVVSSADDAGPLRLDPKFQYLRVVIDGRVIFMASDTPDVAAASATSVWYSAGREVLRLRDGRVVAAVGMATEWRNVVLPELPTWADLANGAAPLRWTRLRDVMPGYRFGMRDALVLRRITAPEDSRLQGVNPHALAWFEERFDASGNAASPGREALPTARYALDAGNPNAGVVYGEQCLSSTLCFSWQRWPVRAENNP